LLNKLSDIDVNYGAEAAKMHHVWKCVISPSCISLP